MLAKAGFLSAFSEIIDNSCANVPNTCDMAVSTHHIDPGLDIPGEETEVPSLCEDAALKLAPPYIVVGSCQKTSLGVFVEGVSMTRWVSFKSVKNKQLV